VNACKHAKIHKHSQQKKTNNPKHDNTKLNNANQNKASDQASNQIKKENDHTHRQQPKKLMPLFLFQSHVPDACSPHLHQNSRVSGDIRKPVTSWLVGWDFEVANKGKGASRQRTGSSFVIPTAMSALAQPVQHSPALAAQKRMLIQKHVS